MVKNKKLNTIILDCFFTSSDTDINRSILDVVSLLCKHIVITSIPNKNSRLFSQKIIEYLASDVMDEYESALECLHNLMLS